MNGGKLFTGLMLVALGALFLLDQAGTLNAGEVLADWWPLALVLAGALALDRNLLAAILFGTVGMVLLAATAGLIPGSAFGLLWPLALIVLGVWVVFGWRRERPFALGEIHADDKVDATALLSSRKITSRSRHFHGGKVSAVFGGIQLDLLDAVLAPGATLDVTVRFGGVEILVPPGWRVRMNGPAVFGGYENHTEHGAPPPEGAPCLEVRLQVLFGGANVKVGRPRVSYAA